MRDKASDPGEGFFQLLLVSHWPTTLAPHDGKVVSATWLRSFPGLSDLANQSAPGGGVDGQVEAAV